MLVATSIGGRPVKSKWEDYFMADIPQVRQGF